MKRSLPILMLVLIPVICSAGEKYIALDRFFAIRKDVDYKLTDILAALMKGDYDQGAHVLKDASNRGQVYMLEVGTEYEVIKHKEILALISVDGFEGWTLEHCVRYDSASK